MDQKEQDYLEVLIRKWAKWVYSMKLQRGIRDDILFLKKILVDGFTCEEDKDYVRDVALGTNPCIGQNMDDKMVLTGWHLACAVYGRTRGANYDKDVNEAEKLIRAHELEGFKAKVEEARKDFERSANAMMDLHPDRADDIYHTMMKLFDIIDR